MNLNEKKEYVRNAWLERCKEFPWLSANTIFLTMHGSHAYGLNTESSDVDMAGICIPTKDHVLGFLNSLEQIQFDKPDGQIYSIIKFFRLAADNNPNVMELLWIDPKYMVTYDHSWLLDMLSNRDLFLSKKVRYTYSGYAVAQLKRIKTHRKHLLNPPTHAPTREEFGLPVNRIMSRDQQGALDQLAAEERIVLDENFMQALQLENKYDRAKQEWQQYNNWKDTRNPARAELEAKFGFDLKHATHLVRLIRQCTEMLTTGKLIVDRTGIDADELLEIRRGAWTYDDLMLWIEGHASEEVLNKYYEETALPKEPDRKKLHELCIKIVERYL